MKITDNSVVSIHYKLTGNNGKVLDSSENQPPLVYMHNQGSLLPGLEQALTGHCAGETLEVSLSAVQGYGEHFPELVQQLPVTAFAGQNVQAGMVFNARGKDNESQRIEVKSVSETQVTVDANHPLAGENLHFAVAVVAVREPTQEELALGQAQEHLN